MGSGQVVKTCSKLGRCVSHLKRPTDFDASLTVLSVFTSGWNFPYHMDDHVFLQKGYFHLRGKTLGF